MTERQSPQDSGGAAPADTVMSSTRAGGEAIGEAMGESAGGASASAQQSAQVWHDSGGYRAVPLLETSPGAADRTAEALRSDIAALDDMIEQLQTARTALMRELGTLWKR